MKNWVILHVIDQWCYEVDHYEHKNCDYLNIVLHFIWCLQLKLIYFMPKSINKMCVSNIWFL